MFAACYQQGQYKQALGIALEARRLDHVQKAIAESGATEAMLEFAKSECLEAQADRQWRLTVLRELVALYRRFEAPRYRLPECQCLVALDEPGDVSTVLQALVAAGAADRNSDEALLAMQIAFDLVDNAPQHFLAKVQVASSSSSAAAAAAAAGEQTEPASSSSASASLADVVTEILTGKKTIAVFLEFLYRNCRSDLGILQHLKKSCDQRSSIVHNALVCANALMHAGTTRDTFLRQNLDWLSKAANWAKFTATAGLGVIHRGHLAEAMSLLSPYLPQAGVPAGQSPYSEGGGLFALGLIHALHGHDCLAYLKQALAGAENQEVVQHGACLGLGVAALATGDEELYEQLRGVLYADSAVAGEAAALAMGLVLLGSAHERAASEMLAYAHDTQHEKIIRGLAMGLALLMYGREQAADTMIQQLAGDKDPLLRAGAMLTTALAYAGSGDHGAVARLLHVAVSDVDDDVRRAAVTALGFVLFRQRDQAVRSVALLAESYNPHVRYGAAVAVGVACAGAGAHRPALALLQPLLTDSVDFVRQGALLAQALLLIETSGPQAQAARTQFQERAADKHEPVLARMGAILAAGIIDAGGRNCTVSLQSPAGQLRMPAIVGLAVFLQHWHWFPFTHFLALALTPTAVVGLNHQLKMPQFEFISNAKPSKFAYPPAYKPPEKKKQEKVSTAVLSYAKQGGGGGGGGGGDKKKEKEALKSEAKQKVKEQRQAADMEVDDDVDGGKKKKDEGAAAAAESSKQEPPEPESERLANPHRVTEAQFKFVRFDAKERYQPIAPSVHGILVLKDTKPDEPVVLVDQDQAGDDKDAAAAAMDTAGDAKKEEPEAEPEAAPPAPFTFDPTKEDDVHTKE